MKNGSRVIRPSARKPALRPAAIAAGRPSFPENIMFADLGAELAPPLRQERRNLRCGVALPCALQRSFLLERRA